MKLQSQHSYSIDTMKNLRSLDLSKSNGRENADAVKPAIKDAPNCVILDGGSSFDSLRIVPINSLD